MAKDPATRTRANAVHFATGRLRELQGSLAVVIATLLVLMSRARRRVTTISWSHRLMAAMRGRLASLTLVVNSSTAATCTTGG